jgi:hypothetical protein
VNQVKSLHLKTVDLDHSIQELTTFVVVAHILVSKCGYSTIDAMNNALSVVGVMIMGSQRKRDACQVKVKTNHYFRPRKSHIKHYTTTEAIVNKRTISM